MKINNKDLNKLEYAFKLINEIDDDFVIDEIICDAMDHNLNIDYLDYIDSIDDIDYNQDYDLDYLDNCFDINSYNMDLYYDDIDDNNYYDNYHW